MAVKAPERSEMVTELLERIGEAVGQKAQVSTIFGEPRRASTRDGDSGRKGTLRVRWRCGSWCPGRARRRLWREAEAAVRS
jgi:hypothetical protein